MGAMLENWGEMGEKANKTGQNGGIIAQELGAEFKP